MAAEAAVEAAKSKVPAVLQHKFCSCVEHAIAHIEEAVLHDSPEEQIFTDEILALVQSAVDSGAVGAEEILGAVEEADFGAFARLSALTQTALQKAVLISRRLASANRLRQSPQ